ncbi:MATE family efflux transporter [Burkholderia plantarii]|uniref:Multidrug-efflux transporter n=1 Tax=Burkholderia plantarii TaxID=41899 RepID=A0A0B6RN68_BURPL|nr:MATE family efflux transporter [Burkholderia plantarii]AJK46767.1 MATE efflux family protein [Burkholderia plantarii]ALK30948.1 MATE efflux family protein [Burkholderia plantarii]WLE59602.1 MATE family efflux transporter [Burkholderia plantarii]GLZ17431.1 MATE family efflux transporter [Burkholderia plantarii]
MLADVRRIAGLAWPVLIGQLAIIAFGVIDTAMVGRYSALDLAALGLGSSIYVSVFIGLTGILSALQPIAGQLYGARRFQEIGEEVRQAMWLAVMLAVPGFLLLHFPELLLRAAHTPAELHDRTVDYLRILAFGLPASLMFRIYNALTNAAGKPRLAMFLQLGALALKIPLNIWFIFGGLGVPALGGPGCGLASTLINWALALIGFTLVARLDVFAPLGIFARFCTPTWQRQKALLKLGLPMGLSYLIEVTSYTFMALFISHFGTTVLAGHQIAGNLGAVLYMTPLSIGIAASTLVARALGAGRPDEARLLARHGVTFAALTALGYACVVLALRHLIIGAYTPNPAVVAAALPLVTIVAFYHCVDAIQVTTAFVLRAYKVAVVPTVIYAVALWGVGVGGGYLLGFDIGGWAPAALTGARGFWFANFASLLIAGAALVTYLNHISLRWLRHAP